jgi:drug/metabolite transporter (DMT)-like permease
MIQILTAKQPGRTLAIVEVLVVMAIWGSSFILVKRGLDYFGPLTIAGLRYVSGCIFLLPFVLNSGFKTHSLPRRTWLKLFLLGLSAFAIGNGALFWGMQYTSATTASFMLNLTPLIVLFVSVPWLREAPTRLQVAGVLICIAGGWLYFAEGLSVDQPWALLIMLIALLAFAFFGLLGRDLSRLRTASPLALAAFPLGMGGAIALLVGLTVEGLPAAPLEGWLIILWLGAINTAFAYMLYYHALQVLTALELNTILNLSPLVTGLLAWLLLGDLLVRSQLLGIIVVIAGVVIVQANSRKQKVKEPSIIGDNPTSNL